MIVDFNFNLETWVRSLKIEANSEEDAINKLKQMSLENMINDSESFYIDSEMKLTDIESKIAEYDATIKVSDIKYFFDESEYDKAVIDYLIARLPKELTITIDNITDDTDLEDAINYEIFSVTGYDSHSFNFEVIEKK